MEFLLRNYDYYFDKVADPRVKDWVGFSDPTLPLTLCALYLVVVLKVLPTFMKGRKPYSLKTVIYYYNLFQIVANFGIIVGLLTAGSLQSYGCMPVDYSDSYQGTAALYVLYFMYVVKGIDFVETAFFVLRKKFNQVSGLHLYHHVTTFLMAWIGCKYVGGGMVMFPVTLNCGIHVIMYTYYLLASLGPEWQTLLSKWKRRLTIMQMVQFGIIILHSLQSLHPECQIAKNLMVLYVPNVLVNLYMFYDFYKNAYLRKNAANKAH